MAWGRLKTLWRNLARTRTVDTDLDGEIRSYQTMLEDEKVRAGVDPRVARREALLELGGAEQIKEEVRDVRLGATLSTLWTELRQSARGLRRNPGLTILGAVMLALGIGASTVVFSIFYAALLKPLPFRDSERVVQLWETRKDRGFNQASFTEANFWDVREQNRSFEEVAAYHDGAIANRSRKLSHCFANSVWSLEEHDGARRGAQTLEPLFSVASPSRRKTEK